MNTVLLILAALGLAFIVLAMAVFLSAARRNVSDAELELEQSGLNGMAGKTFRLRSGVDRRQADRRNPQNIVRFPLTDSEGRIVEQDRRRGQRRGQRERRRA